MKGPWTLTRAVRLMMGSKIEERIGLVLTGSMATGIVFAVDSWVIGGGKDGRSSVAFGRGLVCGRGPKDAK